ncbi:unnamed protein product [Urochloa humidicola]
MAQNQTLDDPIPMEGPGVAVAARPGLVAASDTGQSSGIGSSLGATSATAARKRKPGRWRRIPRPTPTAQPIPTAKPTMSPNVLPRPPPGTTDFRPYLPSFRSLPLAPEPRESGEARQQLPSEPFPVFVVQKGSKEEKELQELRKQRYLQKAKDLEEEDEDPCDSEEARLGSVHSSRNLSAFIASLPPEGLRMLSSTTNNPAIHRSLLHDRAWRSPQAQEQEGPPAVIRRLVPRPTRRGGRGSPGNGRGSHATHWRRPYDWRSRL